MNDKKIKVEIVFPVHNRRELTLQCLKSLAKINRDGLDVHIIMVDDGSTDGTADAVKNNFPEVEIINGDGNLWFTEGTNVGVRRALKNNPDYVLTMNDDQIFDSEFLQNLIKTAEKYPRSIVGALLLLWDQPHKLFQVAPEWGTFGGGWRHWVHQTIWTIPERAWKVNLIVGNCVLFPKGAFDECGLMNSKKYPMYGDAELTPRMRKMGWTLLIEPSSRVFCQPNNLPPKIGNMNFKEKIEKLIVDLKCQHNLRHRFYSYTDGAPSKLQGLTAFGVFFVRTIFRRNYENEKFRVENEEMPLKERYAAAVVSKNDASVVLSRS